MTGWSEAQARLFVKRVKDRWGSGWKLISDETKRAYLDSEALSVVAGNHAPASPEDMSELRRMMHEWAGVEV